MSKEGKKTERLSAYIKGNFEGIRTPAKELSIK